MREVRKVPVRDGLHYTPVNAAFSAEDALVASRALIRERTTLRRILPVWTESPYWARIGSYSCVVGARLRTTTTIAATPRRTPMKTATPDALDQPSPLDDWLTPSVEDTVAVAVAGSVT